jgi:hypothetical protein
VKGTSNPTRSAPGGPRWSLLDPPPYACWAILCMAWLAAAALLLWLHRDLTFAVDEFGFSDTVGSGSLVDFLAPKNGHLIVLPLLVYKLLYESFGTTLVPFTLLEGVMLALISAGLYVFARTRIGPLLALVPAVIVIFPGSGWPTVMPPMIGLLWMFAIAAGIWALLLVERETAVGDVSACVLLCLAMASFSLGAIFVAACAVAILFSPGRRRRLFVVVIPAGAWIAWHIWATKFGSIGTHPVYLLLLPAYAVDSIAANAAAIFGRTLSYSPATSLHLEGFSIHRFVSALDLAVMEALVCLLVIWRIGARSLNRPSMWIVLAIPVAWWASQVVVLEATRTPSTNRYFFAGVVILLMVVVEVARGVRVTPIATGVVFALAALAIAGNMVAFRDGRRALVALSQEAKADMAAIELAGSHGDPSFVLSTEQLTPQAQFMFLTAGEYLDVVNRYGSPADTLPELERAPGPIREAADITLARSLLLELSPAGRQPQQGCRSFRAPADARRVVVTLPRGGAILSSRAPRALRLGRFASGYPVRVGELGSSAAARLEIPADRSRRPWRAMAAGTAPLLICPQ